MTSNIYTRTGDSGTTSLAGGMRRQKDDVRVEAYGAIDEANSWIGTARAFVSDLLLDRLLEFMQHRFYSCCSGLAHPPEATREYPAVTREDIEWVERAIDRLEVATGAIKGFVLPGGTKAAAILHVARTVVRRGERRMWTLAQKEHVDENALKFVNRSSDFLFAAARYANAIGQAGDVLWQKDIAAPLFDEQ